MRCPRCQAENPDDAQICSSCSANLNAAAPPPPAAPQGPATAQMPFPAKTSGMAIAALVLGILSPLTFYITALPAIILGIIALVNIGRSAGQLKGKGLAIAGIVVPAAWLFIMIPMMMAILMPALARTRQLAFRMTCSTNMSGLGKAMLIYANDYDDEWPTSSNWCDLLIKYAEVTPQQFVCKGASQGPCNYAMNENMERLGTSAPDDMVLLFETSPGWNQVGGPGILTTENHSGEGCNVLFVDSHVEFVKTERLDDLVWAPD